MSQVRDFLATKQPAGFFVAAIGVGAAGGLAVFSRLDDTVLMFAAALVGYLGALTAVRQVTDRALTPPYRRLTVAAFGVTSVLYVAGLAFLARPGDHDAVSLGPFGLYCVAIASPMLAAGHVIFYRLLR